MDYWNSGEYFSFLSHHNGGVFPLDLIIALHARHKRTLFCRELPLVSLSCPHLHSSVFISSRASWCCCCHKKCTFFFISSQSGAVICDSFTENLLRYAIVPIRVWSSFAFWGDWISFIAWRLSSVGDMPCSVIEVYSFLFILEFIRIISNVVLLGSFQDFGHDCVMFLFCWSCYQDIIHYTHDIFNSGKYCIQVLLEYVLGYS